MPKQIYRVNYNVLFCNKFSPDNYFSIGFKTQFPNQNESTYDLIIDASATIDPVEPESQTKGMSFAWFCRLKLTPPTIKASGQSRSNDSSSEANGGSCISDVLWSPLPIFTSPSESKVVISTAMFLEGAEYDFKVIVRKGSREGMAFQTIDFVPGVLPSVKIICHSNCKEKVNSQDELILKLQCDTCRYADVLISKWKLLDSDGNESYLMKENTTTSGWNQPNLALKANVLKHASNYTL